MGRKAHSIHMSILRQIGTRSTVMTAALIGFLAFSLGISPARASQCSDLASTLTLQFDNGAALVGLATVQDITSGS